MNTTTKEVNEIAGVMKYADGTYAPAIFTRDYADNWYCWVANKTLTGSTRRAALMAARKTMKFNKANGIKALNEHWTSYTNGASMIDWFKSQDCFHEQDYADARHLRRELDAETISLGEIIYLENMAELMGIEITDEMLADDTLSEIEGRM